MRVDRRELGAIFAGGFLGTIGRAELAVVLPNDPAGWPWSTLIVNILGAFMLGYLTTRLGQRLPPQAYRLPFLATGLCGALTTFSTMQIELLQMLAHGRYALAAGYALVSIGAGFFAVALATNLVRRSRLTT